MNPHRLAEAPVIATLLEHLPGDAPYSTHLELEGMRARLVHRELLGALRDLASEGSGLSCDAGGRGLDYGRMAADRAAGMAMEPQRQSDAVGRSDTGLRPARLRLVTEYATRHRVWPGGGLIDLVV